MNTRQATIFLALLAGLYACAPSEQPTPTSTFNPPTSTPEPTLTFTPLPPTASPTSTPLTCLTGPGYVESGVIDTIDPAQELFIYLPPCYEERPDMRYPVLYLLHGQTYTADQWIRIGAVDELEALIHNGETQPFIIVFPDDQYWNYPAGAGFGQRLVELVVPYVDANYRTMADREHRAIGGLSRGAGWALRMGLTRWDLFSVIGLHSLAVLQKDASQVDDWLMVIPPSSLPVLFMDSGDNDQELNMALTVEARFNEGGLPHEWHRYSGAHTEEYWSAHVAEYIAWYAEQWNTP